MPYCPSCKSEYREGIEKCSDCGDELVDELPAEPAEIHSEEPLVTVFVTGDPLEAEMVREILDGAGIPAHGSPTVSAYISKIILPSVDRLSQESISVLESRADEARKVIEQALESGKHEELESD